MFALLLYRLILLILLPILLIVIVIRSKNNKAYRQRLSERLGLFPKPSQKGGIVVHAASVGEVIALKSFIEQLLQTYPNLPITITTFTPTGSAQVKKLFGEQVQHGYLPIDIMPCTQLFLQRLAPKLIIFMETELWPNLISQCKSKNIKLLLINGRLSKNSLNSYKKIKPLMAPCLNSFDKILTQSQENLEHFIELGANQKHCLNSGNLKFDISINDAINKKKTELAELLLTNETNKKRNIWLVASTHEGDEAIALAAFKKILKQFPTLLLVLVPRHPERFEHVANLCLEQNFSLAKRSDNTVVKDEQIWLLDSLGELMAAFALSDIVTMGGSFSEVGGHNPLEPALFEKPVIVGSNMSNFNEVLQQMLQENALVQLSANATLDNIEEQSQQLSHAVLTLLSQPTQQALLGGNAHKVVLANQGASKVTLQQVQALIHS